MNRKASILLLSVVLLSTTIINTGIGYGKTDSIDTKIIKDGSNGWEKVDPKEIDSITPQRSYALDEKENEEEIEEDYQNTYSVLDENESEVHKNIKSVFDAIGLAKEEGWVVKENYDLRRKIFKKTNSEGEFNCFQGSTYYKTVYNVEEARDWVKNYGSTHVYDGTGILRFNSNKNIKGIPDSFALEPESGGYYYKFSNPWINGKSSSTKVNLSKSKLNFSNEEIKKNNAYIYKAIITSSQIVEFGVMTTKSLDGKWVLFCRDETGFYLNRNVVVSHSYFDGKDYLPIEDIEITISKGNGFAVAGIKNSRMLYQGYRLKARSITDSSKPFFMDAVSFVPDAKNRTGDLGNGAYLKNIELSSPKIYSEENEKVKEIEFFGNSNSVAFSFLYNDDVSNYTRKYNTEVINIRYDLNYRIDKNSK